MPKNWCPWIVGLEKTLESLLNSKEVKPVNLKGNNPWVIIGRTDAKAEAPILWLPDANSWLIGKDLDPGQDWGQEEKGVTEDEIVGWHHQINVHESESPPGDSERQGNMVCCSSWGCKECLETWLRKWTMTTTGQGQEIKNICNWRTNKWIMIKWFQNFMKKQTHRY